MNALNFGDINVTLVEDVPGSMDISLFSATMR